MRVLHVTHQYAPAIGGAEQYIKMVSEGLAQRGHDVDVYTSRSTDYMTWRNELPYRDQLNGVSIYRHRALQRRAYTWLLLDLGIRNRHSPPAALWQPLIFLGNGPVMPGLARTIRHNASRYDLVHISSLHYAHAYVAFHAARAQGLPVIVTPHLHAEQPVTYDVAYMRTILRRAQAVLSVTRPERDFLIKQKLADRVVVGGNGLVLTDFPPLTKAESRQRLGIPSDKFVMLFLGRKVGYKGLADCVSAFNQLRRHNDLHLLAYGAETAESEQLWQTFRRDHGDLPTLDVRGAVTDSERLAALAACDVLVMPSIGEAFGITYLEAWAYAKPVIGANIQSVASLIEDGVDGYLVDAGAPVQLADRIGTLLAQPERARRMGEQGRAKLLRRYTSERITDIVEGLYRRVIRHAGSKR